MALKLPLLLNPEELYPDPRVKITAADLRELEENPVFLLVLARLCRKAHLRHRLPSDDEWKLTSAVLRSEGALDMLRVINDTLAECRDKGEE